MKCPQCNHEQTCPCPTCQSRYPTDKPWIWTTGDSISCGNCGLHKSAEWWFDREVEFYAGKDNKEEE